MLFVMLIVGLLVGLTAPRFGSSVDRYRAYSQHQEIADQLRQMPRRARLLSRSVELPRDLSLADMGDGDPPLRLPEGWAIGFSPPLVISSIGACTGSQVVVYSTVPDTPLARYQIMGLSCEIHPATN